MKNLSYGLVVLSCLFFSFSSYAQQANIVPFGQWGSAQYTQTVNFNGLYYAINQQSSLIDVIDPTLEGEKSLVAQFSLIENITGSLQTIKKYGEYFVVLTSAELLIYSVKDITEFTLEYSISANGGYSAGDNLFIDNDIYLVDEDNQIFIIANTIDGFEIQTVFNNSEITSGNIYSNGHYLFVDEENIYLFTQYYDPNQEKNINKIEVFDVKTYELLAIHNINDIYTYQIAFVDKNRFIFNIGSILQTVIITDNSIEYIQNFGQQSYSFVDYLAEKIWAVDYSGNISSYVIDQTNNVTLIAQQSLFNNESYNYNFDIFDMRKTEQGFVLLSNLFGLTDFTVATDNTFSSTHLYNQSGSKGQGVFIDDLYYVPTPSSQTITALNIATADKITQDKVLSTNRVDNILAYEQNYLFLSYNQISMQAYDKIDEFSKLSSNNEGAGYDPTLNENYLFIPFWNLNYGLKRYNIASAYALYESPLTAAAPKLDSFCINNSQVVGDIVVLNDYCVSDTLHIFSDVNNADFAYHGAATIDNVSQSTLASFNEYLYIINESSIRVATFNNANELTLINTINNNGIGHVSDAMVQDEKLIFVATQGLYFFDLTTPSSPVLLAQSDQGYFSYDDKISYSNSKIAITTKQFGQIKFFKLNSAPFLNDQSLQINEDESLILDSYFSDDDGDSFIITVIDEPQSGTLIKNSTTIYQPNDNFNGSDSFTVKVTDSAGNFIEQEVNISVIAVNDAPVINTTELTIDEDNILVQLIDIKDVDGDLLSYSLTKQSNNGSASLNDIGELTYQPNDNYYGNDSITISVAEPSGFIVEQIINITVNSVNDLPVITVQSYQVNEDADFQGQLSATDIENQVLSFSVVSNSAINGQASMQSNGQFTFTPTANFYGNAQFDVQVIDSEQGISQQTIDIEVTPMDDAPSAEAESMSVSYESSVSGALKTSDIDGDTLTYSLIQDVSNGSLTLSASGEYSYTANSGYSGADSFIYEISDGTNTAQATVSLNVQTAPVKPTTNTSKSSGGGSINFYLLIFVLLILIMRTTPFTTIRSFKI